MNLFAPPLWLHLSLFGYLSANFFVEAGTVPSKFRKNHSNVVSAFQEQITWIFLSNKSAQREKSHQVVTKYEVSLFSFGSGDKKFPVYDTWWLNIYKHKTYRMPCRFFLRHTDFFEEIQLSLTTVHEIKYW